MHLPTCRVIAYDWAAACSGTACVLDFFSDEVDVGSEWTKLHIVHYDDMTAYFKLWSNHYALYNV